MPAFEVWSVVRVPFPYSDRPIRQRRPALVVARTPALLKPRLLWVLMITSARHRRWPGDVEIADPGAGGLPAPSIVRTAKIAAIEELSAETVGLLSGAEQHAVQEELASILRTALYRTG